MTAYIFTNDIALFVICGIYRGSDNNEESIDANNDDN